MSDDKEKPQEEKKEQEFGYEERKADKTNAWDQGRDDEDVGQLDNNEDE